jgi:Flp pilus assembly protein CpaB
MLVATGGSIAVWTATQTTRGVLVATRELPAGTTLTPGDVTTATVRLDDALYAAAVPASQLATTYGRQLAEPAHPNQVLVRAQVSGRPLLGPDQMVFAIPVRTDAAAGGRIRAADNVQVFVTEKGGATRSVVSRAVVYDVGRDTSSSLSTTGQSTSSGSGSLTWLTLIVNESQAMELARARWNGDIDVALLPPPQ